MFRDRIEAGEMLAIKLLKYKNDPAIVVAVPRGGIPIAYVVAKELNLPLDIIFTKKIGHPINKEYAIGAASLTDYFVVPHDDVTEEYIQAELKRVRKKLTDMYAQFMGNKKPQNLTGKTVIVIDDGIATGNTLMATVNLLHKSNPAKIVIAVPVASSAAVKKLSKNADEVISVLIPDIFHGVGRFYKDFNQVSDEEVIYYLQQLDNLKGPIEKIN